MNTISSSLLPTTEPVAEFPAWVTSTPMPPSPLILEIGAGTGMFDYPENIRGKLGAIKLVGVDPDIAILTNSFLDERHVATAEQFAAQDTRQFDCIYSMFVVEHVSSPRAFMAACHKLLKPHGSFFAMTCNYWHYFGFLATISEQLGVQDNLLARLRGKQLTESYHFKTAYKLNDARSITRTCEQSGFSDVEFRYFDPPRRFAAYLPSGFKWWAQAWSKLVYGLKIPKAMGMLMWRATK